MLETYALKALKTTQGFELKEVLELQMVLFSGLESGVGVTWHALK